MAEEDIFVADVQPNATVSGTEYNVTHVEVKRSIDNTAAVATLKGIPVSPQSLERGQSVTASINGTTLFTGRLNKATQANSGLVTITAYDQMYQLQNKTVQYNSEEPERARTTITKLLSEAGVSDYSVAPGNSFPGGDSEGKREYGSGKRGENLANVLLDLTKKLGGVMWVDRENTLRIEPYPEHKQYLVKYIIDLNAGEGSSGNSTVIVEGGSPASAEGLATSYVYDQFALTSRAETESIEEGQLVINDKNIVSPNEANSMAASESVRQQVLNTDSGAIEVVGNPVVSVFDHLTIPELEDKESYAFSDIDDSIAGPFSTGVSKIGPPGTGRSGVLNPATQLFTAKTVTHVANAQNGYTTTIDVAPGSKGAAQSITGPASAIANELLDKIEENEQDPGSPLNYLPGFE